MCFKRFKVKSLTKKIAVLQRHRLHEQPSPEAVAKEIALLHRLSALYHALDGHKKVPFAHEMRWECLRAAGSLEDANALYQLGHHFIEEGKWREQLQNEVVFASERNNHQMQSCYEEGHAYLQAAVALNYIEAQRFYGLCYINGWGVAVDRDKGFESVVASIEKENSWDRVPEIFAAIGLNKPEFFSALMQRRAKRE